MKNIVIVLIALALFGCGQNTSKEGSVEKIAEAPQSKFQQLLTKYKDISFDTLEVFAVFDMERPVYKFSGAKLNNAEMDLLPESLGVKEPGSFFACYKFPMDASKVGLITRTPGEYSATSLKLLILDTKFDSIVSYFELSELSGDAGDAWQKTSWLFKNDQQHYRSFLFEELTHDHIHDEEPDTFPSRTNNYYLVDFSVIKPDTISTDSLKLTVQFSDLLRKKSPAR
jgi:hypothetical protein